MFLKRGLCLLAVLYLTLSISQAQSVDTLAGKLVNFPSRLFSKIQSQSVSLSQQVTSQSQQYLARMARRERQMQQKMSSVDSNGAKALFANSQQQYAALTTKVRTDSGGGKAAVSGQYQPYVDTLQGAMAFLQQHPQLLGASATVSGVNTSLSGMPGSLAGSGGAAVNSVVGNGTALSNAAQLKLQAAASQFQVLQTKMQDADMVKAYVQSRQQQISQYLAKHAAVAGILGKSLTDMQQQQVYYTQRLQQYKAMLADPSALAQRALAMLSNLPAFQNFMKNNSQLGSLFHVPGTYGTTQAVTGLQTKAQVAQIVQKQISAAGSAGAGALQANLQSAESQLDGFKDKLSKLGLGGAADALRRSLHPTQKKRKPSFIVSSLGLISRQLITAITIPVYYHWDYQLVTS